MTIGPYDAITGAMRIQVVGTDTSGGNVYNPDGSLRAIIVGGARTLLIEAVTFHVSTAGSDANDGSASAPWLTLQYAYDWIAQNLDQGGYLVTIQLDLAGSYPGIGSVQYRATSGPVLINGNAASHASYIITNNANPASFPGVFSFTGIGPRTSLFVTNVNIQASDSDWGAIVAWYDNSIVAGYNPLTQVTALMTFSGTPYSLADVGYGATIELFASTMIIDMAGIGSGSYAHDFGYLNFFVSTLTFSQALAVSDAFIYISLLGLSLFRASSITGSAVTGKRYVVDSNGVFTQTTVPPGTVAGTTATGGQVI